MVSCYRIVLDRTFAALSDPTRRAILTRLIASDGLTVGSVAEPFAMSLPAVIKHLDVLADAGLVTRTRAGRNVTCRVTPEPMSDALAWLERHARVWEPRLDALVTLLEERKIDDRSERAGRSGRQKP